MSNIKVVCRLPRWPRLIAVVALSVTVEWGYSVLASNGSIHQFLNWVLLVTFFMLFPVVLSFGEQRLWRAIIESFLMGASAAVTNVLLIVLATQRREPVTEYLVALIGGGAMFAVPRLIAVLVVRNLVRKVIVQTGSLCWTCAYNLTGNVSGVCPECGTKV